MDFFEHQDRARRKTSGLVVLYALAVSGIVAAVYLVMAVAVTASATEGDTPAGWWDPGLFAIVTIAVLALVSLGSLFKTFQLSKGGSAVATSLGGRPVAPDTQNADERKLLHVVEEMALAVGVAVPQVYLLDDERGINAFAAGFSTRDAVIGVTRGCVESLTRDELQGVIAHEFSHIVNGDMRLNIRLMGILFGILMLTIVGRILLRSAYLSGGRSRDNKKGGNPLPFIGLALIVIGYIGVFFANLIKSAISRQREYLADAAAVQYTRHPDGISGALKKIGGLSIGATVKNVHASEASHMFFGSIGGFSLSSMFATHPPLAERIRRLDPAFNPAIAEAMRPHRETPQGMEMAGVSSMTSGFATSGPGSINLAAATAAIRTIPEALLTLARDPAGARAVVYGLLWSDDANVQSIQRQAFKSDSQAMAAVEIVRPMLARLPAASRLPVAELAVPALRLMAKNEYERFRQTIKALTEADNEIDLFEFALSHLIMRHVESTFGRTSTAPVRYRTVASVLPACTTVLAGLAIWGTSDAAAANVSFQAGWSELGDVGSSDLPKTVSLEKISQALSTLCEATPAVKRKIIEACRACILADENVAMEERELLRAVADAMDVPMPPLQAEAA